MDTYILITGSSSGIGKGVAIALSKTNKIILSGRDVVKLEELRQEFETPEQHLIWKCDLYTEYENIFDSLSVFLMNHKVAVKTFIHCAGIAPIAPLRHFVTEEVEKIFRINVFSAIEILRVLLKKGNKAVLRNILFMSSLASIRAGAGNGVYGASKSALVALVNSLAQELAPGIRINAVSPGTIEAPGTRILLENNRGQLERDFPLGIGTIEDVVNSVLFLIDEKAKWITGQNLIVDGGRSTK